MMNPISRSLAAVALLACFGAVARDHVLLNARFDSETVGAAPGIGGATVGEPISNDSAIVGLTPFASKNLQIRDTDTYNAQNTAFGFLNNEEVVNGTVQIRAQVLFTSAGQPQIELREQGTSAQNFLDFYSADNDTYLYAYTGSAGHNAGQFTPNAVVPLEIDASADQKLVSIRLNGTTLLDRAPIALITTRGIGTILVGVSNTSETVADVMRIDNLRAVACTSTVFADCLFVGGFNH